MVYVETDPESGAETYQLTDGSMSADMRTQFNYATPYTTGDAASDVSFAEKKWW